MNRNLVVMGVAGCGKSSIGAVVARSAGVPLIEGDTFHSPHSVAKMRQGVALDDSDRAGWLDRLGAQLQQHHAGVVLTCSALRRAYRERLRAASPGLRFAFLEIAREQALRRVAARGAAHFFSTDLVGSQFDTLESPVGEHGVLRLDATAPLHLLEAQINAWWREHPEAAR
jgi:gluconokinase